MTTQEHFLQAFEPHLIGELNKLKGQSDAYKQSASYDICVTLYEKLLVFINQYKKQEIDMSRPKVEFGDLLDIADIPRKEAGDSVKRSIRERAKTIPKGTALVVRLENWGTFSNAVAKLKEAGDLGPEFKAQKRGDVFLLRHE